MDTSHGGGEAGGSEREKLNSMSSSTTPIAAVASFWKEFDLEKERIALDEQGLRIAENQENSQKNRRKLAESTRDFKKASNEDKLSLFNSLLKGYQEEVDNLTKRAKFGENAFLNIYQKIYEAPDPYPLIASIAMEEKVKEIVEIKQRSLAEENQKTLEVLKEREQLLQDQLRQAQESVSTIQKLHELAQSQLFELHAQSEEERASKQSEVNLLMDEVERAQGRLLSLEREKGVLRSQLQLANEDNDDRKSDNFDTNSILENSLSAKEKIISELNMELHNLESTLSNEREEHINEVKKLNVLLHEKEVALDEMKKELQSRPTAKLVDDLKKKVQILQAVGYNSIEAEDWEAATSGEEMSKLESLLLDKNRKMEHELTQLKMKLSERASLLESAEAKIDELTVKVGEQQRLNQKLEDDILKGYSSKDKKSNIFDDWDLSESRGTEPSENVEQKHTSSDQDQSSMLKVICNQRDRFRSRLRETEEEIRRLKEKIGVLTAELEKTKADNVKLYEKIRYVQDYNSERVISRGSKKYAEDLEIGFGSDVESKYKKMYEDDINPFAAFSKKERDQRYKELGLRDKITLSSGRFLLGNKLQSPKFAVPCSTLLSDSSMFYKISDSEGPVLFELNLSCDFSLLTPVLK
nr:protein CASP-like isoform X3 [Ipomoea trifida]